MQDTAIPPDSERILRRPPPEPWWRGLRRSAPIAALTIAAAVVGVCASCLCPSGPPASSAPSASRSSKNEDSGLVRRRPDAATIIVAVQRGDVGAVQALLGNGADPNAVNAEGRTAFSVAIDELYREGKYDSPYAPGPQPTEQDTRRIERLWLSRRQVVELLLKAGGDPNTKVSRGATPLLVALDNSEPEVAMLLVQGGADPRSPALGELNTQALANAVTRGYVDVVKLLIARGANLNERHGAGYTPLMQAAKRGNVEVLEALVRAGAQVNAVDDDGNTALMQSVEWAQPYYQNKPTQGAELAGVTNRLLLDAWASYPRIYASLLRGGADLDVRNRRGQTAEELAAQAPELDKVLAQAIKDSGVRGRKQP